MISVYIIFIAGAIVRMTGSGMGCPDWPKCFGYLIPPTSEDQISWKPNTTFIKDAIIIKDETLYVSENSVTSSSNFNASNWKKYTKHNYVKFNVFHTWTEYINRLTSAVSGNVFFYFLIVGSLYFWRENRSIAYLSFGAFFLMLFEAWLGMKVVETVLNPKVITIHMLGGFIINLLIANTAKDCE